MKNPVDLKTLMVVAVGTWIALFLFIAILVGATKAGFIRNPSSVWCLPKTLNTHYEVSYYVCTMNGIS